MDSPFALNGVFTTACHLSLACFTELRASYERASVRDKDARLSVLFDELCIRLLARLALFDANARRSRRWESAEETAWLRNGPSLLAQLLRSLSVHVCKIVSCMATTFKHGFSLSARQDCVDKFTHFLASDMNS